MLNECVYYHESYVENKCPRMISELLPWLKKKKKQNSLKQIEILRVGED